MQLIGFICLDVFHGLFHLLNEGQVFTVNIEIGYIARVSVATKITGPFQGDFRCPLRRVRQVINESIVCDVIIEIIVFWQRLCLICHEQNLAGIDVSRVILIANRQRFGKCQLIDFFLDGVGNGCLALFLYNFVGRIHHVTGEFVGWKAKVFFAVDESDYLHFFSKLKTV